MTHAALSDSARMILDSAIEFAEGSGGALRSRVMRDRFAQLDERTWQQIVSLGWPAMSVAEEHGGLGLGLDALATLCEGTGRMLLPEPLAGNVVAAQLLSRCGSDAALALLREVLRGTRLAVPVLAVAAGGGPLRLRHVPDTYPRSVLLVAAGDGSGFSLRAVAVEATGVTVKSAACVDGSMLSSVEISDAAWETAPVLATGDAARDAHATANDSLLLAYAATLVGVMDEALQQTLDYMKVRQQFGTPIGSFQALQHRAASCHVDIQAARALVYEACKAGDPALRGRAVTAAKGRASAAAVRVTKECVQFHGAIGFADEHNIGLYLKKAMALSARAGGELQQRARYAQLMAGAAG